MITGCLDPGFRRPRAPLRCARATPESALVVCIAALPSLAACTSNEDHTAAPQPVVQTFSPSPAATPSPSPEPSPEPRTVSINYSGDLLWHTPLFDAARRYAEGTDAEMNFLPMLEGLSTYVSAADLAICHSEVPFAPQGGPYTGYPAFSAPQEIADTYPVVGWDICTTASNHSLDVGFDGLVRTLDVHDRVGVKTSGTYRSAEDSTQPTMFTTDNGVKIAVVSATFSLNGIPLPDGKPWAVQMLDVEQVLANARAAREQDADIVVVHMHAGEEEELLASLERIREVVGTDEAKALGLTEH